MSDLTLIQRLQIAGGIARVLQNHPGDVSTLVADARKAMGLAAEIHGVIDSVTAQSAPKPPAAPAPGIPGQNPDAPWINPEAEHPAYKASTLMKMPAARAIEHVEQHGLSAAEQAIFDRASQSTG